MPGFCVIIFAYAVNVSFGVRDSRNEAKFAPSHFAPPKNISSHQSTCNESQECLIYKTKNDNDISSKYILICLVFPFLFDHEASAGDKTSGPWTNKTIKKEWMIKKEWYIQFIQALVILSKAAVFGRLPQFCLILSTASWRNPDNFCLIFIFALLHRHITKRLFCFCCK